MKWFNRNRARRNAAQRGEQPEYRGCIRILWEDDDDGGGKSRRPNPPLPLRHDLPDYLYGASELVHEDSRFLALLVQNVPALGYRWLRGSGRVEEAFVRYPLALILLHRQDSLPRDIVCVRKEKTGELVLCRFTGYQWQKLESLDTCPDREAFLRKAAQLARLPDIASRNMEKRKHKPGLCDWQRTLMRKADTEG